MAPFVRWALLLSNQAVCCVILLVLTAIVGRQVRVEYIRMFGTDTEYKWNQSMQHHSDINDSQQTDGSKPSEKESDRTQQSDVETLSAGEKSDNQSSRQSESSNTDSDPAINIIMSPTSITAKNRATTAPLTTMPSEDVASANTGDSDIEVLTPMSMLPAHSTFMAGALLSVEENTKRDSTSATASADSATVSATATATAEDDTASSNHTTPKGTALATSLSSNSSASSSSTTMTTGAGLQICHINPQLQPIVNHQSDGGIHTPIKNHGHRRERRRPGKKKHRKYSDSRSQSNTNNARHPSLHRRRSNSTQRDGKVFSLVFSVKLLVICICFCWSVCLSLIAMFQGTGLSCQMSGKISASLYQIAKGIAFTIFVDRVQSVFHDSVFEYKSKYLRMIYAFIAIHTLVFSVLWLFVVDYGFDPSSDKGKVRGYNQAQLCLITYTGSPIVPAVAVLCEVSIEIATLHMFTNPLRKLIRQTEMDKDTLNMARLASKTTILTWITILTLLTFTLVIVMTRSMSFAGPACSVLFVGCLLLFPAWFDHYYEQICVVPIFISQHYLCTLPDEPTKIVKAKAAQAMKSISELSISRSNTQSSRHHRSKKKNQRKKKHNRIQSATVSVR